VVIFDVKRELFLLKVIRRFFAFEWKWTFHKGPKERMRKIRAKSGKPSRARTTVIVHISHR